MYKRQIPYHSPQEQALQALNREVIAAMGMVRGVTHAEFILSLIHISEPTRPY